MADKHAPATPIPPHTVRHVDGVMHLTLEPTAKTGPGTGELRFQPPTDPADEA